MALRDLLRAHALIGRRLAIAAGVAGLAACGRASSLPVADVPVDVTAACAAVERVFADVPRALARSEAGAFEYAATVHRGCVVTLAGDADALPDATPPVHLLQPASSPAFSTWTLDRGADGKDGTSFRLRRGGVFCAVDGSWDGGDDSEPDAPRSPIYLITIRCAADAG